MWVILFAVGMWLAMHKPLWNDELSSQRVAIQEGSWGEILTGRIHELNNPPLYYALQKGVTSIIHLSFPDDLIKGLEPPIEKRKYFLYVYPKGQIILRLLPDIFMTTAIVFLVYFFWTTKGVVVGLMALLSALSSEMVWRYWAEARPYPLWFLLTLLQAVFLIEILSESGSSSRVKFHLAVCHFLLAITVTLGFFQIIIAQAILFLFGQRQLKDYLWAGILPAGVALFFFSIRSPSHLSSSNMLYMAMDPMDIIRQNFSLEQVSLLFFYLMAFFCRRSWVGGRNDNEKEVWKGLVHLPYLLISMLLSALFFIYVYWHWPGAHEGVPVYDRHFLFLSALGVVLVPSMFSDLWSQSRGSIFWRGIFSTFFILLLFSQLIEGFANAWFQGYYF